MLALVKLLVSFLASLSFFLPHGNLIRCSPGKTPHSAPSSCETIHFSLPLAHIALRENRQP